MKTIKEELLEYFTNRSDQEVLNFIINQPLNSEIIDLRDKVVDQMKISANQRSKIKDFIKDWVKSENIKRSDFKNFLEQIVNHSQNLKELGLSLEIEVYGDKEYHNSSFILDDKTIETLVEIDEQRGNAPFFINEGELPQADKHISFGEYVPTYDEVTRRAKEMAFIKHYDSNMYSAYLEESRIQLLYEHRSKKNENTILNPKGC